MIGAGPRAKSVLSTSFSSSSTGFCVGCSSFPERETLRTLPYPLWPSKCVAARAANSMSSCCERQPTPMPGVPLSHTSSDLTPKPAASTRSNRYTHILQSVKM